MKCEEVRENLAAHADGEIEGASRRAVDEHLAACPACAEELRALAAAWRLLDLVDAPAAPAGFADRVRARAREGGGAPAGRLLRIPLPAAAAAAALLAAAGVMMFRSREVAGPEEAPPVPVLEDLALLESLDLLQAGEAEALDRLDDFGEEDLAVLGG